MSIEEPVILSVETATRAGSVCVTRGETLLALRTGDEELSQSNHLLDQIADVLKEAGVFLKEIEYFAVARGPGSFTGIRIGIATIKSFAATLGRQTIGIQTLHAIAYGAGESTSTIASLPAGRGELYAQRFSVTSSGDVTSLDSAVHVAPQKLLDDAAATRKLLWAGNGARVHVEEIKARALAEGIAFDYRDRAGSSTDESERWTIEINPPPLAVSVARIALCHAKLGAFSLPEDLHAVYVRPSDAEMNERC